MLSIIITIVFAIIIAIIAKRYLKLEKELKSTRERCRIRNHNAIVLEDRLEKLKAEYARLEIGMKKTNAILQQRSNDLNLMVKQNSEFKKIIEENKSKQEPKKKTSPRKKKTPLKNKED